MNLNNLSATMLLSISNSLKNYGILPSHDVPDHVRNELEKLMKEDPKSLVGSMLELLAQQKRYLFEAEHDLVELVWSGPEVPGLYNRDTMVVVDELFRSARKDIFISGYNFYEGKKIFKVLCENLEANPGLKVSMFFNISKQTNHEDPLIAIDRFKKSFLKYNWGSDILPDFYFDPRSLEINSDEKAVLHAKTIIVDSNVSFVTSANFTGKAQKENIEVGSLIKNTLFSSTLRKHFVSLIDAGIVQKLNF